ncbi:hypothetical protein DWU99_19695 [Dyella psychrodurans]|uniref:Uncharacterized protein n=1 Tax=Dyella psychrodurans TaxID=1927960 RepID=A0A370WWB3_9GAMM|nr:hypothetical protein DWU99_19695 [Dyella psychrodurans]
MTVARDGGSKVLCEICEKYVDAFTHETIGSLFPGGTPTGLKTPVMCSESCGLRHPAGQTLAAVHKTALKTRIFMLGKALRLNAALHAVLPNRPR